MKEVRRKECSVVGSSTGIQELSLWIWLPVAFYVDIYNSEWGMVESPKCQTAVQIVNPANGGEPSCILSRGGTL